MRTGMGFARVACIAAFVMFSLGVGAQNLPTVSLESIVVDDFDENPTSRWIARGSKFATVERDDSGKPVVVYPVTANVPGYPVALFGKSRDKQDRGFLGVRGKFDRKGYNFMEIVPAAEAPADAKPTEIIYQDVKTGKKFVHRPIDLPGKVAYVDLWVWGSNLRYYLDAHFEDHRGVDYVINMGDLNFFGWRNLRIAIPSYISQSANTVPRFRALKLTKFTMWTRPEERVDEFYIYFDHLRVLTDLFQSRYDGDELEEPETLQKVWGTTWRR